MSGAGVSKWMETGFADTACAVAANQAIRRRLKAVDRLLTLSATKADEDVEHVHRLRVATRRARAALAAFQPFCLRRPFRETRTRLRRIRRAATEARRLDVQLDILTRDATENPPSVQLAYEPILQDLRRRRNQQQPLLQDLAREHRRLGRREGIKGLLRFPPLKDSWPTDYMSTERSSGGPYTLGALASTHLPALLELVQPACEKDLNDPIELHALRINGKKLRYALELFAGCYSPRLRDEIYPRLETMLEDLGRINDYVEIVSLLERAADSVSKKSTLSKIPLNAAGPSAGDGVGNGRTLAMDPPEAMETSDTRRARKTSAAVAMLLERYRRERDDRLNRFLDWWRSGDPRELFDELFETIHARDVGKTSALRTKDSTAGATASTEESDSGAEPTASTESEIVPHRRVAAIDVGTNSIRLVVGESDPFLRFRVIQEVKETTRLGAGVYHTGRIKANAFEASIEAIARMKAVAEACHVERIRAVGTSAVREATNGKEFIDRVREKTGIVIEVVSAESEARLSFSSVANAFELDDRRVAIVDIGGGSTEVVMSSGGVIDAVCPLPLGAVRLTDAYFQNAEIERSRFEEMCRSVDRAIAERIPDPQYRPYMILGTGGSFTSLARVAIRQATSPSNDAMVLPSAVRGYELRRSDVTYFLDKLRKMPLEERRRVPGLSSQRAEIIVAGVCIIERLMQFFRVARVRVHDGGIRHGLLADMLDRAERPSPSRNRDSGWMDAVRRFAERCGYEQAHSEHVAKLALSILDQLAAQDPDAAATWANNEARELLLAAGVLHDVGMAVEIRRHHRHSYDMIVHADLPALTRRESEIIANIARYHRRKGPSTKDANFRRLGDDDQRLVAHLVGILRVADGLDRLHDQSVRGVVVTSEPGEVRFSAVADEEPVTNLRYGARKADVFEKVFGVQARFTWTRAQRTGNGRQRIGKTVPLALPRSLPEVTRL